MKMTVDNGIRVMAGVMVLLSLALSVWVSPWWLLLAVFIGLNLIQSAFSGFCPPGKLLTKLGFQPTAPVTGESSQPAKACCTGRFPAQLLIGLLTGAVLTGATVWIALPRLMLEERVSQYATVDETIEQLKATLDEQGWVSPGMMDMNKSMEKHGVTMDRTVRVLNLCKPAYAKDVLDVNPEIATLMPCSWGVYQADDGNVHISTLNMGLLSKLFGGTIAEVMGGRVASEEQAMLSKVTKK